METLTYQTEGKNNYTVFWTDELNGGGMYFGPEYPFVIKSLYPDRVFNTCFEWCSGPGFIGYNILDHGICNKLVFLDIYKPATDICYKTAQHNNLLDLVQIYNGDNLTILPESTKVDLVVANPPHYNREGDPHPTSRVAEDPNWEIHRMFYKHIGKYLSEDGVILIQENQDGSNPEYFYEMIDDSNLKIKNLIKSPNYYTSKPNLIYYIEITHKR